MMAKFVMKRVGMDEETLQVFEFLELVNVCESLKRSPLL